MRSPSRTRPPSAPARHARCTPGAACALSLALLACGGGRSAEPSDLDNAVSAPDAQHAPATEPEVIPLPLPHCAATWRLAELEDATFSVRDACAWDDVRWFPLGGPRGVRWDTRRGEAAYGPDWLEGGRTYDIALEGWRDGAQVATGALRVEVEDVVQPPPLRVDHVEPQDGGRLIHATIVSDSFLDAPGYAGREVAVRIAVPAGASPSDPRPVELMLHGFDGQPDVSVDRSFHVAIHDPENTYWWGYGAGLPTVRPEGADVPDYTLRKALWALAWTLDEFPGADRERVYVHGSSMGGTGAATVGLLYARHFAWVSSHIGQTIPRNHRPRRLQQLGTWYGAPGELALDGRPLGVWDALDLTRVLRDDPIAREAFVFLRHGRDDTIIHFGAVVQPSPLTGLSFYGALQAERVGHYAVWDESGHGTADPVLPSRWWHSGWHPITDPTTRLSLDAAFPAFSNASHDGDTGGFAGSGEFDPSRGYAGDWREAGDTRWNGDIAGALNRGLRWDSDGLVDTVDRFSLPLRVLDGEGDDAPAEGYPCLYDRLCAELPVRVDVSLRRTQAFRFAPGERASWNLGDATGIVSADEDGVLTLEQVPLTTAWQTLELRRLAP